MAESDRAYSPYNYVKNNPIRFIDRDGMYWEEAFAGIMIGMEPLDDYKLLKNGEINLIKRTNDKTDKLYASDSNDNVNKENSITLEKGILGKKGIGNVNTKEGLISYSYYQANGEQATDLFKFATDNSNVEWGLSKFSDGKNVVTTSHSATSEVGTVGALINKDLNHLPLSIFSAALIESTHSHPFGVHEPSGLAPYGDKINRGGDMSVLKWINSQYFAQPIKYNIYTPSDGKFTPYSKDSYLAPLQEVIITAPRRKY